MSVLPGFAADDGFKAPAEWDVHEQTWMGFPQRPDIWRENAAPAQKVFANVANAIARFEPVTVCAPKELYTVARSLLDKNVRVVEMSMNDSWFRDTGAIFVKNEEGVVRGTNWLFNSWGGLNGGCYDYWEDDLLVAGKMCNIERVPYYKYNMILEGGSISFDGEGTLLTTEECLLNPNRNPSMTKEQIEAELKRGLGVEKVIWLPNGLFGDVDTNGHVDNFCVFARPGEVLLSWTDDEKDPQYPISQEAYKLLEAATDAKGRHLKIHKLYIPSDIIRTPEEFAGLTQEEGTIEREENQRLPASYVNFYFANGAIISPCFGVKEDEMARKVFQEVFPEREVVMVPTREVILGGGNIHCITQQQPKGVKA